MQTKTLMAPTDNRPVATHGRTVGHGTEPDGEFAKARVNGMEQTHG